MSGIIIVSCYQKRRVGQSLEACVGLPAIYVVEFQKRGLPHSHVLVKFRHEPPMSALDSFVSAELPDQTEEPALYELVKRFHMHSQDHLTREISRCNKEGRCIYGFPKPLSPHTISGVCSIVGARRKIAG